MLEKMKEIIAEQLSVEADTVTEASSFKEDLGADSLDLFELVMALEDEYSVEIPAEDLEQLTTVEEIIAEQLSVEADTVTEASSFKEDLGADSLDLFELVMALEDEYSVEIPAEDLEQLTTVGEVMNYLKAKGVEA